MNIYDCAIKIEEESEEYYEGLKTQCRHPEMKNLFSILAASKAGHKERLLKLKSSLPVEKASLECLDASACTFRPALTQGELLEDDGNDPDLYQFTVREEEQEIRFYEDLAKSAGSEESSEALLRLAEEERQHLEEVEHIYAYVEEPRTYLEWGEFSNRREL